MLEKSSILYQFLLGQKVTTIPTVGFNVETLEYKKIKFTVWDFGGGEKAPALWRQIYSQNTHTMIFVIDSNDREVFEEAKREFQHLMTEDDLRDMNIHVLANKQDCPGALTVAEITDQLRIHAVVGGRKWLVQGVSARSGEGRCEALDWLYNSCIKSSLPMSQS